MRFWHRKLVQNSCQKHLTNVYILLYTKSMETKRYPVQLDAKSHKQLSTIARRLRIRIGQANKRIIAALFAMLDDKVAFDAALNTAQTQEEK